MSEDINPDSLAWWWEHHPEHAERVDRALHMLMAAIDGQSVEGASVMVEAATVEWCVEHLRDTLTAGLETELRFRDGDDGEAGR